MNKEDIFHDGLKITIEVGSPKFFVKVKEHTRLINGKSVKIRSHYRRVLGPRR